VQPIAPALPAVLPCVLLAALPAGARAHAEPLRWRAVGVVEDISVAGQFVPATPFAPGDLFVHDFAVDDTAQAIFSAANIATFPAVTTSKARLPGHDLVFTWAPSTEVTLLNLAGDAHDLWDWSANTPNDIEASLDPLVDADARTVGFTQFGVSFALDPVLLGDTNPPAAALQPSPDFGVTRYEATWAEAPETIIYTLRFRVDDLAVIGGVTQPFLSAPADLVIDRGDPASFQVQTDPDALAGATGRWRRDGTPLHDDGRITGAATPSLTISGATPADAGFYTYAATADLAADLTNAPLAADLRLDLAAGLFNLLGASLADPADPLPGPDAPIPLSPAAGPDTIATLANPLSPTLTLAVDLIEPDLVLFTRTVTEPTVLPGTFTLTLSGLPDDATVALLGSTLDAQADSPAPNTARVTFQAAPNPIDPGTDFALLAVHRPTTFTTPEVILAVRDPSAGSPCPPDLAHPAGILDLDDINAFIAAFTAGCP